MGATNLAPVFGQVFIEGAARPVFSGTTLLPLPKLESMFRRILRKAHPTARKVCLTLLKSDFSPVPPEWFVKCGGKFLFAATKITSPVKKPLKEVVQHAKKRPVKARPKKVTKRTTRK